MIEAELLAESYLIATAAWSSADEASPGSSATPVKIEWPNTAATHVRAAREEAKFDWLENEERLTV